jgi:hypothetical protein
MIELPEEIEHIAEAGPHADCYEQQEDGRFKLTDAARAHIAAVNVDLERVEREAEQALSKERAELARLDAVWRDLTARSAIRTALVACGVQVGLDMALPYLAGKLDVQVSDDGDCTSDGVSVQSAVASWLASEEGVAFRPKPATHEPGPFTSAVRRLNGGSAH